MITSTAPTRIDLAGGTLDIWPLFLHFDNPPTLNVAIDLLAAVEIKKRRDRKVAVVSRDLGKRSEFASIDRLPDAGHPLELLLRTLKFYRPECGLELTTDCRAPAGSGIAGSSALNIALNGALNRLTRRGLTADEMIRVAKSIETQVIRVPTGWQDYFPAMYGGALAVQPGFYGVSHAPIRISLEEMTRRIVLCYTGRPRRSGINNWQVMKQTIEGDRGVIRNLQRIRDTALRMREALENSDWNAIARTFAEEWRARRVLAPGISTPEMEKQIAGAMRKGALAAKVCGAGGGGCVAFFVRPEAKSRVEQELAGRGARILPFRCVRRGLVVRETPDRHHG